MDLLGDDSDSEVDFTINEDYAKRYEKWRRGEEIQKLKDKYGNPDDSDSSTSEEEDEDGKELTKDVEKQFFKTLSCLKEKNPKIYDQNVRFFEKKSENEEVQKKDKKKNEPTLTLAGYQRKVLLETGGQFSDDDNNNEDNEQPFELMSSQDQEKVIKQSFKDVLKDSDNEDDEQWGNLFTKRVKTAEELEKEEEDYRQWLAGEKEKVKNEQDKEDLKGLHDYWTDPKLDEGEKFLRDYILNKRYLENEDKNRIPSYDEIVHDSDSNLSADEDTINQQDAFERKYNFRFEEPDKEFIKRYPRTLEQSMRKKDERRKKHREEVKQRKQEERSKKDEELKRLKTLKKKEIMDKIKKLQQITGNDDIAFQTEDLEGDFDPVEYDKRMSQLFNNDYYGNEVDEEKPEFPEYDEELEIENWDDWQGPNEEEELHCEDPGFNMDCDYDPTKKRELQNELIENSRRRKRRRKSKFAEALEKEKPVFDPKDKTFEQYVDEYYSLDYEDLIGDIPCRFKYRKVVPNDFGLSIEEILNATDQELNRWVSIKKITRRLPEHVELYDVKAFKKKAANQYKKAKCFPSLYGPKADDSNQQFEDNVEFKKGNKNSDLDHRIQSDRAKPAEDSKKKKSSTWEVEENVNNDLVDDNAANDSDSVKKKKSKKRKMTAEEPAENKQSDMQNRSDNGAEGTKKSKKQKINSQEPVENKDMSTLQNGTENVAEGKKKKKKKKSKKQKMTVEETAENKQPTVQNGSNSGAEGKKISKKQKMNSEQPAESSTVQNAAGNSVEGKKRKRRRKSKGGNPEQGPKPEVAANGNSQKKSKKRTHSFADENANSGNRDGKSHKKGKFSNYQKENQSLCNMSDERLRSYGLNPKKYKNKLKYKNKNKNK